MDSERNRGGFGVGHERRIDSERDQVKAKDDSVQERRLTACPGRSRGFSAHEAPVGRRRCGDPRQTAKAMSGRASNPRATERVAWPQVLAQVISGGFRPRPSTTRATVSSTIE
jgi:hypothetical protein